MKSNKKVLALRAISKYYQQGNDLIAVLRGVNLTVDYKDIISIVGTSGSGKSTLLHIAGLLDFADSGVVYIDGVPNLNSKISSAREIDQTRLNNIGFVYQNHHLLQEFTAQENVSMPLLINNVSKHEAMARAEVILNELSLSKKLCHLPGELSGGEQQRVAIARALIHDPKILLADEPTGNLDPDTSDEVFAMFLKYVKNKNAAIVMVSHNLRLALKMRKVYKLDRGSLVQIV